MPASKTAVDGRVVVRGEVVVRAVDTDSKVSIRRQVVYGPIVRNATPYVTATAGRGGAEVRAVVTLAKVIRIRSSRIADV